MSIASASKFLLREKDDIIKLALYQKDKISFDDKKEREILKVILKKPSKWRNIIELMFVRKFFQNFNVFIEMEKFLVKDLINQLFREIQYIEKKPGEIIFQEGEIGENFYIIIEGEVDILESKQKKLTFEEMKL